MIVTDNAGKKRIMHPSQVAGYAAHSIELFAADAQWFSHQLQSGYIGSAHIAQFFHRLDRIGADYSHAPSAPAKVYTPATGTMTDGNQACGVCTGISYERLTALLEAVKCNPGECIDRIEFGDRDITIVLGRKDAF